MPTLIQVPGTYYTKREVAEMFGVSHQAVYKWLTGAYKTRKLPGIRISGWGFLIHEKSVEDFATLHKLERKGIK